MNLFIVGLDEFFQGPAGQRWTLLLARGGFHPQYQRERLTVDSVRENHRGSAPPSVMTYDTRACGRACQPARIGQRLNPAAAWVKPAADVFVGEQRLPGHVAAIARHGHPD